MESADDVQISFEAQLKKAADEFDEKMKTKIHRFPAGLRGVGERYIIPIFVAIGPYHHGSGHLKKMEKVKHAAAHYFSEGAGQRPTEIYNAVLSVTGEARKLYSDDAVADMGDADFAAMMYYDACFLLLYMEAYSRYFGENNYMLSSSWQHFFFPNRDCINNDIMLLENQLPWPVLEALMNSLCSQKKETLMKVVGEFIAQMGNDFRIREDIDIKPFNWDDIRPPPPHLLGLLRCHKTEPAGSEIKWPSPKDNQISTSSAIELAEIGIKLTASKTPAFIDMDVKEKGPLCGELSLAPLSLDDKRACCLVNMAALEVSTASRFREDPNTTAVCSYLALFSMFMLRVEDVHELRAKCILHGHHTNEEMRTFFKNIVKHLPDSGCRFAHIMARVEEYKKKRRMRTKLHKLVYNNFKTIIKVLTIVGTLVGIFQVLLSLNQAQKNHTPQYFPFIPA